MPKPARFIPLTSYREYPQAEMIERAHAFNADLQRALRRGAATVAIRRHL